MEEIKVSIIIPVYNTSKYLKTCLDSLVNQTLREIEIICVDDGSSDNSLEILKEYRRQDNRVKILTQNHKKQGAARNYGIRNANGEYIAFVDSDDWCEADMYEKLYKRAKETDSDVTMCAVVSFNDNNSNEFSKSNTNLNLGFFTEEIFNNVFSPADTFGFFMDIPTFVWNKIIKKSLIEENDIKFVEDIYFEDGSFSYDCWLSAKRISLVKDFEYYYRMYSDTSTCFTNDFYKLHNFKALREKERVLKKHKIYSRLKKDFIENKRKSVIYWENIIKDKRVKFIYKICALFLVPSSCLYPLILFKKELYLLLMILTNRDKKIVFWGASLFIENFIKKYNLNFPQVLGLIDKDSAKQYINIGRYTCYPPEKLKELGADIVVITILNAAERNLNSIKKFLDETKQNNVVLKDI